MKKIKYLPIVLIIISTFTNAQIVINEFMAKNVSSFPDIIDFDDFSDWIEIYNNGNSAVDLSNYFLTDNSSNPLKWEIPTGTTIAPNGFLIFFADGYDSDIGNTYMRDYWPWDNFTTKSLHTNFKLSSNGESIAIYKVENVIDSVVISKQSAWKYLDDGSDQGAAWKNISFDDSNWKNGIGIFGYGNNNENTTIDFGGNSSDKHITTYFRTEFHLADLSKIISIDLNIMRDDGAVVYLNGMEVVSSNMPAGAVYYNTKAESVVSGSDESKYFNFKIDKEYLFQGVNKVAVELHQISGTSSDISFDLELKLKKNSVDDVPLLVDSVSFGHQFTDISYGRIYNSNSWGFFNEPTPGESNLGNTISEFNYSPSVNFSLASGYYSGEQVLSLSAANSNIYYTLDGSIPDENSKLYTNLITLSKTTIVRARVYSSNQIPGNIESNSYFIDEKISDLPVASVIVDGNYFWDEQIGIYKNNLKGKEVPISLEYFKSGEKQFDINAGVKIGGYNIWRYPQKPLNIYLDSDYGNSALEYKLFDSKPIANFTSFEFRNGGDNWTTTLLQDAMAESLIEGHLLNGFQAYKPVVVFINGEYWGIHNLRERFDETYYYENFGVVLNEYEQLRTDLLPPDNHLGLREVKGSATDYNAMVNFAQSSNMNDSVNYNYINSLMNVDSFIDCIVGEIYVCNTSWRHNREWWRPLFGDKKWQWLLPDIDRGFNINNVNKNLIHDFVNEYDLFNSLLKNTKFKQRFIQKFSAHLSSTFAYNRLSNIIDSLSNEFRSEMPNHINRWESEGGIKSIQNWENELTKMKDFSLQRNDVVYEHIKNEFSLSGTSKVTINLNNSSAGKVYLNDVPLTESYTNIKVFNNIPFVLKAVPNSGYNFHSWGGIVESNSIDLTIDKDTTLNLEFIENNQHILSNSISTNLTLTAENSPYIVEGTINIEPNVELNIKSGVKLLMGENSKIIVQGALNLLGNENSYVEILTNESTQAGDWSSIYFYNATDTSHLKFVKLSGANVSLEPVLQPAAINSLNSNIILDHLEIREVNFPIFIFGGSIVLSNSKISAQSTCDYINVKSGNAIVKDNYFYGNIFSDTDAIDYDGVTNGIIANNKIYNFIGYNSDGIDIGEGTTGLEIYDNKIYNSRDKGISVGQKSDVHIYNNLIVGCYYGIGVKDSSLAVLENNTFYGNSISINSFEKNYKHGGGNVEARNCILSESKISSTNVDGLSKLKVDYSISDTDVLLGVSNLFDNPLFADRFNYNFELKNSSICIDKGDPLFKDKDGSRSDIGYNYKYSEFDITDSLRTSLYSKIVINEIMYNTDKNKASGDWIELYNQTEVDINLKSWKISDEDSLHLFVFPNNKVLKSNEYLVICKDTTSFKNVYPGVKNYIGDIGFGLSSNDKVVLINNNGKVESFVDYDNNGNWPSEPDGTGKSLELLSNSMQNYTVLNWSYSKQEGGTPGGENNPITGTESKENLPDKFFLSQNYPNPFNPTTVINYSIPERTLVNLSVYNVLGERITTLVNEQKNAGIYKASFNAEHLASGIYIYRIKAGQFNQTRKLLLLK